MKKLFMILIGGIAFIVALSMVGPMIGLAFSAFLVYLAMYFYVKSNTKFSKVMWILLGIVGILSAISNIPAMIGLVALAILYVLYKKSKNEEVNIELPSSKNNDPFVNFENEWSKLTK